MDTFQFEKKLGNIVKKYFPTELYVTIGVDSSGYNSVTVEPAILPTILEIKEEDVNKGRVNTHPNYGIVLPSETVDGEIIYSLQDTFSVMLFRLRCRNKVFEIITEDFHALRNKFENKTLYVRLPDYSFAPFSLEAAEAMVGEMVKVMQAELPELKK